MAIAAHTWPAHINLAAVETDLSLRHAPALANALSAAAMARTGEPLCVLAQHLLHRFDAGRQTEAFERTVHILPSRFKARHQRDR